LHQLIENLINVGLFNEALLLTERLKGLASKQGNQVYIGGAYQLFGKIFIRQNYPVKAKQYLRLATSIFSSINDVTELAKVAAGEANIALGERNYVVMKNILLKSINLLKKEGEHFQALEQTITLAVYANKLKEIEERDYYLAEAKQILDSNGFQKEHYSSVYFQQGLWTRFDCFDLVFQV